MMLKLFGRSPWDDTIARLYGTIVAQARAPAFYQIYGVPDTVGGRLEMIMLHTVLLLRRLEGEPPPIRALGQGLFDRFCRDMDDSMRELGVGDLAVPRSMRRIGEAFYGRQAAYREGLDAADDELLPQPCSAMYLPARRNVSRPASWQSMYARPRGGLRRRMDLSARNSPFPTPNR